MRVSFTVFLALHSPLTYSWSSIVEFASQEDAQRAIRELSEVPLLGRPVFIREVISAFWRFFNVYTDVLVNKGPRE